MKAEVFAPGTEEVDEEVDVAEIGVVRPGEG